MKSGKIVPDRPRLSRQTSDNLLFMSVPPYIYIGWDGQTDIPESSNKRFSGRDDLGSYGCRHDPPQDARTRRSLLWPARRARCRRGRLCYALPIPSVPRRCPTATRSRFHLYRGPVQPPAIFPAFMLRAPACSRRIRPPTGPRSWDACRQLGARRGNSKRIGRRASHTSPESWSLGASLFRRGKAESQSYRFALTPRCAPGVERLLRSSLAKNTLRMLCPSNRNFTE